MPYFDHNATTPLLAVAREAWLRATDESWANPSSPYRVSARVHRELDEARERVAALLGVSAGEIVFTSGATEANNAVITWASRALPGDAAVLVSSTEHPSVLAPARVAWGNRLRRIDVAHDGTIDAANVRRELSGTGGALVAIMAANNETGILTPLDEIGELCRARRAFHLCDASQWIGRLPACGIAPDAFIVGCAHKFGGPKGVGFLRIPAAATGFHAALGGEQEQGRRAGTENFPAVAAMVAALEYSEKHYASIRQRAAWADACADTISTGVPRAVLNTGKAPRLWNTLSLRMPAHENTRWVVRLDKLGFEVSTGSACASGSAAPSHVLAAMGLSADEARRTIRISSGWETTDRDWQMLAEAVVNVWQQLQLERENGAASVIQL